MALVDLSYLHFGAKAPVFVPFLSLRFWAKARSEAPNPNPALKHRAIQQCAAIPRHSIFSFNHEHQ